MPGTPADWENIPLLLSAEEAAGLLRVHVNTVKALCRANKLPAAKVGRAWRINRADLIQFKQAAAHQTPLVSASTGTEYAATLLGNISDAVVGTDAEHRITAWNHAAEEMFGWHAEEVLGQPIREFLHRDYHVISLDEHYRQLSAGDRWRGRVTVWRRDGAPVDVETTALALRGGDGKIAGHVAVSRDMTEQVRTASRLAMLREIDLAILTAGSTREIAGAAVERLREYVNCARASVLLFHPDAGEAELLAVSTARSTALPADVRVPLAWFSITDTFWAGRYNLVTDLRAERAAEPAAAALLAEGLRSMLAVPLTVNGQVIGALDLSHGADLFTAEVIETAQQVAVSLAIAIQNARLYDEAQASRERSRQLSRRLVEVQEDERRRLSRELHDESAQLMTALQLMLARLKRDRDCPAPFQAKIDEARQVANSVVESLRRFAINLRPAALDQYGLVPALEGYVTSFQGQAGVRVELEADESGIGRLPEHVETTLYRLVQEALSNVARHAEARCASISLRRQGPDVQLSISDDGKGFDLEAAMRRGRLGLVGMRERAEMLRGTLLIESSPLEADGSGGGTTIRVRIPYEERGAAPHEDTAGPAEPDAPPARLPAPADPGTSVNLSALAELARAKALTDALNDLHAAFGRLSAPEDILQTAVDHVTRAMGCTLAVILRRVEDGWEVGPVTAGHAQLSGARYAGRQIPFVDYGASTGQVVVLDDTQVDPRFDPEVTRQLNTRAAIVVPLNTGPQVERQLAIIEHTQPRHFTPAEVEFAGRLQVSLSLALENATLRAAERSKEQELASRVDELQTLLNLLPAGVGIAYDAQGRDIRVNPALARLLGAPLDANVSLSADESERQVQYRVFRDDRELAPEELPVQLAASTGEEVRDMLIEVLREDGERLSLLCDAVPLFAAEGEVRGAVGTFVDVTGRQQAEERTRRQKTVQEGISRILEAALTCQTEEELGPVVLTVAKEVTGSEFGFVAEIDAGGRLAEIAISGLELDARPDSAPNGLEIHGAYGRVLLDGKGFYTNDPGSHPDHIAAPEGHPPLTSFLGVPLQRGGTTVGMVALGNRPGGYRQEDLEAAEGLTSVIVAALDQTRSAREIRRLSEELRDQATELARMNGLYQTLQDALPDLVWSADPTGRADYVNKRWEEYTGLGLEELNRVGWQAVNHPVDAARLAADWARAASEGKPFESEFRYRGRDGAYRWFWGRAVPLKDESGRVTRWVGVSTDVQDRKAADEQIRRLNGDLERRAAELSELNERLARALHAVEEREEALSQANEQLQVQAEELRQAAERLEERVRERTSSLEEATEQLAAGNLTLRSTAQALRDSEERFRIALQNTQVLVFQQDRELRYTWMHNPHPHWRAEQVLGRTDYDELPFEDADRLAQVKRRAMTTGLPQRAEVQTTVDGEPFFYDLAVEPLRDLAGNIIGITGAAVNITELKRAQAGLMKQNERLRELSDLLNLTHDAIFVRDMDGTIRFWNRGAVEMYGYTSEEAHGRTSHELLRTEFPEPLDQLLVRLAERGRWEGELRHWTRGGQPIDVSSRWALQPGGPGEAASILEINNDITAYRAAEARREEALHELQAHREQLQALSRRLVDLQERERRYVADQLYNEAGQVLAALKMHLSRGANGEGAESHLAETQQLLDRVMQDLHHLATHLRPATLDRLGLVSALRQYAEEWGREHGVAVQFSSNGGPRIRLDDATETAVYRVVQEALMNVAQHAGATLASVSLSADGDRLRVEIQDDGVGFDPRAALAVGATGLLGMRERAESVGGKLAVESLSGRGTSVTMEAQIDRGTTTQ